MVYGVYHMQWCNECTIDPKVGVRGAKRIGELLKTTVSLVELNLLCEWELSLLLLFFHSCYNDNFSGRWSPVQKWYFAWCWWFMIVILDCSWWMDWRRRSPSNCRWIGEEYFTEGLEPQRCVLTTCCSFRPSFLGSLLFTWRGWLWISHLCYQ